MVGHTHNDVDQRHSLSTQSRDLQEPNLWSFTAFKNWLKHVHRNELQGFFDIDRVYDFKSFFECMNHDSDAKVSTWMHIHLELRSDGTVWARSKPRMGRRVPWDSWSQYYPPPPPCDHGNTIPAFTSVPSPAANNQWRDGVKVIRSLKKAYDMQATHARLIPMNDRQEMLTFLNRGPTSPPPPNWFKFPSQHSTMAVPSAATVPSTAAVPSTASVPSAAAVPSTATTINSDAMTTTTTVLSSISEVFDEVFGSEPSIVSQHNREYQPIGITRARAAETAAIRSVTGKTCRCGSIHHLRTNHRRCPLNPRNRRPTTENNLSSEPPIRRRRVTITQPVVESSTDTSSPQSNDTDTDTDSSSSDDCLLSDMLQEKNIHVGAKIAKYFDDSIYFGRIHSLPKHGEKYYEIVYDDGDTETMTNTQVLKSLSLFERYHKNK